MREIDDFRTPPTSPQKKSTIPQSAKEGHEDVYTPPTSPQKSPAKEAPQKEAPTPQSGHSVGWTEGHDLRPTFKGSNPIVLVQNFHIVRTRNKLCVVVPIFQSIDTRKIKVFVTHKGNALVIIYRSSSFPKTWWDPEKLFSSEKHGEDTCVWKRAFSQSHFAEPVPKKAILEIDLACKARMVEKSYVRSKHEAHLFVYLEKITT